MICVIKAQFYKGIIGSFHGHIPKILLQNSMLKRFGALYSQNPVHMSVGESFQGYF